MTAFAFHRSHPARLLAAVAACALFAGTCLAQSQSSGSRPERWVETGAQTAQTRGVGDRGWHRDRDRGWHWYEADPNPPPVVSVPPPQGAPGSPKSSEPEPLSVLWLQEHLETTRIAAIDNPTRENVELYLYLQKIAMDKAQKFSIMSVAVSQSSPTLDETYQNPTATFARQHRAREQENEQRRVLLDLAGQVGLYYFYRSDCSYCALQSPLLKRLERLYGFHIMPVALDGLPPPGGDFPNWVSDQGQAQSLGVTVTPTLYLFHPPNEVAFIAAGLQSEPDLIERIVRVAGDSGWIGREDMERALRGLPHEFLIDAVRDLEDVDWSDPQRALLALRHASRYGVQRAALSPTGVSPTGGFPQQATPVSFPAPLPSGTLLSGGTRN